MPTGRIDLMEKAVTLRIGLRTAAILRSNGYRVLLTRTVDVAVNEPPRDYNHDGRIDSVDELEARVRFANLHHATVFVAMHINGSSSASAHGLMVYYDPAPTFWRSNRRLAQLLDQFIEHRLARTGYAATNMGIATDVSDRVPQRYPDYPYFLQIGPADKHDGLIGNHAVSALGETLFISNAHEDTLLHESGVIDAIAAGYASGIEQFLSGDVSAHHSASQSASRGNNPRR
jgi:N-acetylmuramoyl-L-alanine amidase